MESRFFIDRDNGCVFSHHGGNDRTGQYLESVEHAVNPPEYEAEFDYFAVIHPFDGGAIRDESWIEIIGGGKFVRADGLNDKFGLGMMRRDNVTVVAPLEVRRAALEFLGIDADYVPRYYDLIHYSS